MVASYPGHMGTRPEYEARDDGGLIPRPHGYEA